MSSTNTPMSTAYRFSVIIPTHNRATRLARAMASVQAQTDGDCEIIVVDDGSSDGTAAWLAAQPEPRLRVLRHERPSGVSAARNAGARQARGEFLVFLDDDDALLPHALATLRARFAHEPALAFAWGGRRICEEDAAGRIVGMREEVWGDRSSAEAPSLGFVLKAATNCAFSVRRAVFDAVGGFDEQMRLSEDRELFVRLVRCGHAGAAIPQVLIVVSEHFRDSLSRNAGADAGARFDRMLMTKHGAFFAEPRFAEFLGQYRRTLFAASLRGGQRRAAAAMLLELLRHGGLHRELLQLYWRNAPEIRALKRALRYDRLRRWRDRKRLAALAAATEASIGLSLQPSGSNRP